MGYISREGGEPMKKSFGTFSVVESPTYIYSQKVSKLHEKLVDLMLIEKETGIAKKVEKQTLRFSMKG